MKQLNKDQKKKYSEISNQIFELKKQFDNISCQLLFVKDYILSDENKSKITTIVDFMGDISNELSIKSK